MRKEQRIAKRVISIITALLCYHFFVGLLITWQNYKLTQIGNEAMSEINSQKFSEASEIIKKGDKSYETVKYLNVISLNKKGFNNYINSSNTVNGILAIRSNQIEKAKSHIIKSAEVKSTPTLSTFGPSMSLANELLKINESEVVLKYLDKCKSFWEHDSGKIEMWKEQIQKGEIPKFGGNLLY